MLISVVDHLPTVSEQEETSVVTRCMSGDHADTDQVTRRQYRRLPDISNMTGPGNKGQQQSSRSFDSGICVLLSDSGSPSPPLAGDTDHHDHMSHLSCQSSSSSPVPARSPITPSKRASFHAYSPAKLPKPPVPPNSPCFKNSKPSFFSARRFSEQTSSKIPDTAASRTLSPISVSPSHKSPSPCFSSSSKSSPQLQRSLGASTSLQSTESTESPPKSPEMCSFSPGPSYSSPAPASSASRRKLPETPTKQKLSCNSNNYYNSASCHDKNLHTGMERHNTTSVPLILN